MRDTLLATLSAIVGPRWVKSRVPELVAYEADGLPGYRAMPSLAVFPGTRDEVGVVDGQAPQARTAPVSRWTKSERR